MGKQSWSYTTSVPDENSGIVSGFVYGLDLSFDKKSGEVKIVKRFLWRYQGTQYWDLDSNTVEESKWEDLREGAISFISKKISKDFEGDMDNHIHSVLRKMVS